MKLQESIYAAVRAECAAQISAVAAVLKEHNDLIEELSVKSLLPGQAAHMLRHLSEQHLEDSTPARLEAHAAILASLRAIDGNEAVQFEARRSAMIVYAKAEEPLEALRQAVLESIERQLTKLRSQEEAWFSGFGLGWEQTAVSCVAVQLRDNVASHPLWPLHLDKRMPENPRSGFVPRRNIAGVQWLFEGQTSSPGPS
jgi:hypothetical protein